MMGIRLQKLFSLMSYDQYQSATYFAAQLDVNLKTVRNDIKKLDSNLRHHGAMIESKAHNGYRIQVMDEEKFSKWVNDNQEGQSVDAANRNTIVLEKLLESPGYVKIDDLGEMLYVSVHVFQQL